MNFSDAVKRIVSGESVNDVIDSLFESEEHGALGDFKNKLRELVKLTTRGFSTLSKGKPSQRHLEAATEADEKLSKLSSYFLKQRVRTLKAGKGSAEQKVMFDSLMDFANTAVNVNVNSTVIGQIIKMVEAGETLRKML